MVVRHLAPGLPAHDEGHENLPDPVPLEVQRDGDPRPGVAVERLDLDGTTARMGPSTPWTAHRRGGCIRVTSDVLGRSPNPIRRVVMHLDPTSAVPVPSICPLTTLCCHSLNRDGSVT